MRPSVEPGGPIKSSKSLGSFEENPFTDGSQNIFCVGIAVCFLYFFAFQQLEIVFVSFLSWYYASNAGPSGYEVVKGTELWNDCVVVWPKFWSQDGIEGTLEVVKGELPHFKSSKSNDSNDCFGLCIALICFV